MAILRRLYRCFLSVAVAEVVSPSSSSSVVVVVDILSFLGSGCFGEEGGLSSMILEVM